MLRALHIRDFVIVDQTEVEFGPGFTVFSGETGAGKSILIDALALALGERGDASLVREGAARADVSAVFDVPDSLGAALSALELDTADGLVMRRTIDAQGRSRAYLNGVPATLAQLRELGEQLVDIHGQHAHQSLMRPDAQRDMLDGHGGHADMLRDVAAAWRDWRELARKLDTIERDAAALAQERERLQWQADTLDRLGLDHGEWEALQLEHGRLAHAQSLIDGASAALGALEDDDAAQPRLATALQRIDALARHDGALSPVAETLESARIALQEAISDLHSYLARLEPDPQRLEIVEQRLQAVLDTARACRLQPEDIPARREALEAQLDTLREAEDVQALRDRAQAAQAVYASRAEKLGAARRQAAASLSQAVTDAMQTLAMGGGRFEVVVDDGEPGPHGADLVTFHVAGHAGTSPRPLAKVASGGELARISLALSVIASRAARVPTLIFDEVDTGIGGAVAEVVGRLLRELGGLHQVLCVTHLPQVAACGDVHFKVDKQQEDGRTRSLLQQLDRHGRVDEIARMLGGIEITATTRKHAREMLSLR